MRSSVFNGVIADARGPFFSSGNWWENNRWWREEWDIQTSDGNLYRIFRATRADGARTVGRASCPVRVAPRAVENAEACPGGTLDNSPGFQAWVAVQPRSQSPEGTDESSVSLPHSKTLRVTEDSENFRQVLECGSPMPLSSEADEHTQSFESFTPDSGKLSLTPRFSGVYERPENATNCFNSFPVDSRPLQPSHMSDALSSQSALSLPFFIEGIYD